jgi:hypothetical protein
MRGFDVQKIVSTSHSSFFLVQKNGIARWRAVQKHGLVRMGQHRRSLPESGRDGNARAAVQDLRTQCSVAGTVFVTRTAGPRSHAVAARTPSRRMPHAHAVAHGASRPRCHEGGLATTPSRRGRACAGDRARQGRPRLGPHRHGVASAPRPKPLGRSRAPPRGRAIGAGQPPRPDRRTTGRRAGTRVRRGNGAVDRAHRQGPHRARGSTRWTAAPAAAPSSSSWVKPWGLLPLSLFGANAVDDGQGEEGPTGPAAAIPMPGPGGRTPRAAAPMPRGHAGTMPGCCACVGLWLPGPRLAPSRIRAARCRGACPRRRGARPRRGRDLLSPHRVATGPRLGSPPGAAPAARDGRPGAMPAAGAGWGRRPRAVRPPGRAHHRG